MNKVFKRLGGLGLAAVLGVLLLGVSGAFSSTASAESPPNPPSRFAGSVLVDGVAPPAGTTIEARIGSTSCGLTATFNQGAESRYVIDVPALDPGATPNCGTLGAAVTFFVGGRLASQTGSWANHQLSILNLTVVSAATATPTATAGAGTPAGTATAAASPTPRSPRTGTGLEGDSGNTATWLFASLGFAVLTLGLAGAVAARRTR